MLIPILFVSTYISAVLAQLKTISATIDSTGISPAPTKAPGHKLPAELFKRQSLTTQICGYVSGGTDSAFCNPGWSCGFSTAQGVFGCCNIELGDSLDACYQPTTCADYVNVPAPKDMQEHLTHYCSDADYPYCLTITGDGMSAFWCDAVQSRTLPFEFALNSTEITSSGGRISSSTDLMTTTSEVNEQPKTTSFSQTRFHGESTTTSISATSTSGGELVARPVSFVQAMCFIVLFFLSNN